MADIQIDGLCKRFGAEEVLRGVSLDVPDGSFVALLGPSGCGKTTLLRILAGLESQDEGSIHIGGRPVDALRPRDRNVAMVFQSYALYPYMTVAANIGLPLEMRRLTALQRVPVLGQLMPGAAAARRLMAADVAAVAGPLGLLPLLARRPAQLSGGQRQRVALARAMVRSPDVFLMDEPLSNLDAQLRADARAEIAELHRRLGATVVYVTHDQTEAMTMADTVVLMKGGQVLQAAPPQHLYDAPVSVAVARFVGSPSINLLSVTLDPDGNARAGAMDLGVRGAGAGPVTAGIRPEALHLATAGLAARVLRLERLGPEVLAYVEAQDQASPLVLRLAPADAAGLHPGTTVALRATQGAALLFGPDGFRMDATNAPALAHNLADA